jgi:hypothetical protein
MKRSSLVLAALITVSGLAGFMAAPPAGAASQPVSLGTFGNFGAYSYTDDNGGKVCFMSAKPDKSEASVKNAKRGEIFLFITHWQGDKTKNVVSAAVGYVPGDAKPSIAVDGKSFDVFPDGETLWTKDQSVDDALALAIQKGSNVTVKAVSKRGTKTTDTYNLKGSGDAYKAISKACGF